MIKENEAWQPMLVIKRVYIILLIFRNGFVAYSENIYFTVFLIYFLCEWLDFKETEGDTEVYVCVTLIIRGVILNAN